jgi:tripartite-type tricarboxylate transporter receptor subunit TctC
MRFVVLFLIGLVAGPAFAAETYPTRPVDIVVPYGPGGTGDAIARQLAKKLEEHFGKPFVVLNKPGGAGTIGAGYVARAKPDGHTLLLGYTSEIAIEPIVNSTTYDAKSFEPIAVAGETPLLLIGRNNLAAKDMREFIDLVRSRPENYTYASAGFGSPAHIAGELLNRDAKVGIRHIPYKGGADAVAAVLGAHVDIYFTGMPPAMALVNNGDIKAFAVTGEKRSKALPDVPTMQESGFANFDLSGWFALFAPAGTPADVLDRLRAAAREALADPGVQALLNKSGVEIRSDPTAQVRAFVDAESNKYRTLITELAIKADK